MNLLKKSIAEFIGTFALVFAGCGSLMVMERFPETMHSASIPVIFGLVIASMIYALGHISGAHFNPAVTLAFSAARHFPLKSVAAYVSAQILGGVLALTLLTFLLPAGNIFGATLPMVSPFKALLWEVVLTFFLMFTIISVATDTRAVGTLAGFAIGASVALCAFVGGPVTGASMNPARSFAPALFQGELSSLWIYVLGPILGAVVAALLYEFIRCHDDKKDAKGCC